MGSGEKVMQIRTAEWVTRVRDRYESGMTIKEYCERTGLSSNAFYYWQRKLRDKAFSRGVQLEETPAVAPVTSASFTEVHVMDPWSPGLQAAPSSGEVRMEFGGVVITANATYPVSHLSELLRGIAQRC